MSVSRVAALWRTGHDTVWISEILSRPEHEIERALNRFMDIQWRAVSRQLEEYNDKN